MKALVIGQGKSGEAAAADLRRRGCEVDFASGYDVVVASPGVPVKSELQFGCEELKRRGWKLLAVTGSKGKSSVVKLVADALGGVPCGNYGRPVSDLIDEKPNWAVVEVSSFQLETTTLPSDTFEAAALLNLQDDHLDRHGSREVYHALKRKLLAMTRTPIDGTQVSREVVRGVHSFYAGSYFDNAILETNAWCALMLMRSAGLTDDAIRHAFARFEPLPHRMNEVGVYQGVRYVDDSKATSITALSAGLAMCGASPVRLIAGGLAKGDDPKMALPLLTKQAKKVYLIGQSAKGFFLAWHADVDCEVCETLERAVEKAMREAEKGETILLSPGTASFDQFKSFEERGKVFANLVKKEGKKDE